MKKQINLKSIYRLTLVALCLMTVGVGEMWGYTLYLYTGEFTDWENDETGKFMVWYSSSDHEMTSMGNHWYSLDVGDIAEKVYIKRCKSDGTKWNNDEFPVDISSTSNVAVVTGWSNSGRIMGPIRHYDGNTYLYFKRYPESDASFGDGGAPEIQTLTIGGTYTGFVSAENMGDNFYGQRFSTGSYVSVEIKSGSNYSGKFNFDSDANKNEIWNYKRNEGWGNWAQTYFASSAYVYFDNTNSDWGTGEGNYNYFMPGRTGTSTVYSMSPINHTNLLCNTSAYTYNDFTEFVFIHTSEEWTLTESQNPETRKGSAENRTATLPKMMDYGSKLYNLYTPSGSGAKADKGEEASLTHTSASSYGGLLNSDQTVNTVVKTTGSYVSANSKAPIALNSYALTSAILAESSEASLTISENTDKVSSCKTATTTFTVDEENLADGYQFDGWFEAATGGDALETNATYSYSTTGARTVYARFSAINYNVTYSAPTNGNYTIKVADGTATSATKTAIIGQTISIAATPSNQGYYFTGWTIKNTSTSADVTATLLPSSSTSTSTSFTMPAYGVTVTANFAPRFGLEGSLYDDSKSAGMPGWVHENAADFTVEGFTGLGDAGVNLRCTLNTIEPNKKYKFRVYDRERKERLGAVSADYELNSDNSVQLSVVGESPANNVIIYTVGYGTYVFHITKLSETNYYPTIEVIRQVSSQLTLGWKHYTDGALSNGNTGGTVTAATNEGSGFAITDGQYFANGSTITFTASPATGYHVEGWYSDNTCTTAYESGKGNATISGEGNVTLALSSVSEAKTVYVKFAENTKIFAASSGNNWSTSGNWTGSSLPTINDVVILTASVEVDVTDAKAKRVIIYNDGSSHTGKLTVNAGKELIVKETVKKTADGSTYSATGYDDIIIGSTLLSGNGALVMGTHDGTNKATVYFATKAKTDESGHNVNQFIGTPFNDENDILYDYYGTKIYKFMAAHDGNKGSYNEWKRLASTGDPMIGFLGYNILTNQTTEPVLEMTGTLCRSEEHSVDGYMIEKVGVDSTENMFANSWVAPIFIPGFEDADFTNIEKTIYIFNAGTPVNQGNHSTADGSADNTTAGQYSVLPIHASPWVGLKVIPSMQAFSVFAKGADPKPKLKFSYERLVYNPALATGDNHAGIVPNRAPQRTNDADAPSVLRLAATGESGYAAKIVLLERTDFSEGYDDGWDGRFLAGDDEAPQMYAVTSNGNMAINCVPEVEGTVLGFKAGTEDESYTFSFDYDGDALYLFDTQTQIYTRVLTGNSYAFTTTDDAAHNRFILTRKAPQTATGVNHTNSDAKVIKFIENNILYIFRAGRLYNAEGQLIK